MRVKNAYFRKFFPSRKLYANAACIYFFRKFPILPYRTKKNAAVFTATSPKFAPVLSLAITYNYSEKI